MQFGSKQKRNIVSAVLLGMVPDVVIAVVAAAWTDSGVFGFFVTLIGLQIVYLSIWAKNAIWAWLVFLFRGRRQMSGYLFDYLRTNAFPEPGDYHDDVESYFQGVMDNERAPAELRIKAAVEINSLNLFRMLNKMGLLFQTLMAYEDALQRYKRSFPAKSHAWEAA